MFLITALQSDLFEQGYHTLEIPIRIPQDPANVGWLGYVDPVGDTYYKSMQMFSVGYEGG